MIWNTNDILTNVRVMVKKNLLIKSTLYMSLFMRDSLAQMMFNKFRCGQFRSPSFTQSPGKPADSDVKVAVEKEPADVESWKDDCCVPLCKHACSTGLA
jgi:hypothetical protein